MIIDNKGLINKTNHDIKLKEILDGIIKIRNSPRAHGLSPRQNFCQKISPYFDSNADGVIGN